MTKIYSDTPSDLRRAAAELTGAEVEPSLEDMLKQLIQHHVDEALIEPRKRLAELEALVAEYERQEAAAAQEQASQAPAPPAHFGLLGRLKP